MIGYKLASPKIVKHMYKLGWYQFTPFAITVLAVVFTDLLKGVAIGLVVSIFFILRANLKMAYFFKKDDHHSGEKITIKLAQEVSFLNKAAIKQTLYHIPENSAVLIDASDTFYIDYDVQQMIKDFMNVAASDKNISVELKGFKESYKMESSLKHVTSK
jgi:MFS superfamily sulfate permease-like transporter